MEGLYKNKYRINSTRLKGWDYSWSAWYHVTICTQDKLCYFGKIVGNKMILNQIGRIVYDLWSNIPKHHPNVALDRFVIMPNHIHGIIILNNGNEEMDIGKIKTKIFKMPQNSTKQIKMNAPVETRFIASPKSVAAHMYATDMQSNKIRGSLNYTNRINLNPRDAMNRVSTDGTNNIGGITGKHNPMLKKSLATVIRWYKGRCAYDINHKLSLNFKFKWQPSFHDSIITSKKQLEQTRYYIYINPAKWESDRNNLRNI